MFVSRVRRYLTLVLLLSGLAASPVAAQTVTLAWDPSADATGYVVRWGTVAGLYPSSQDVGALTTATVSGLTPGTRYWAVVEAYDETGEYSDPSVPVDFIAPLICNYATSTGSLSLGATITTASVGVTVQPGCPWLPVSRSPFIDFPVSGTGSGTLNFSLMPNYSTAPRTGSATIGDQSLAVLQAAAVVDPLFHSEEAKRGDLNGDGFKDLIWQDNRDGYLAAWTLRGTHTGWTPVSFPQRLGDTNWKVVGTGDFNADGHPDLVFHNSQSGDLYLWYMNGTNRISHGPFSFNGEPDTRWKVVGIGDFNNDQKPDIVWQHDAGWLTVFYMDGNRLIRSSDITPDHVADRNWRIVGVADLNGDHNSDLIFQHRATGDLVAWFLNGTVRTKIQWFFPNAIIDRDWQLAAVLDMNNDQTPDLVWQHGTNGGIAVWYMNGTIRTAVATFPWSSGLNWKIVGPK